MSRRQLNRVVTGMRRAQADERAQRDHDREQAMLGALFDLELPCVCGHELGFHRFTIPSLPTPCGFTPCDCANFVRKEDPVLNPHDPFAGMVGEPEPEPSMTAGQFVDGLGEPEPPVEPMTPIAEIAVVMTGKPLPWTVASTYQGIERAAQSEPIAQNAAWDRLGAPVGAADPHPTETSVRFPVVVDGPDSVDVGRLLDPAQRVAEIIEALETALAPPLAVKQLMELVDQANALTITDADTYKRGCDLYEDLSANAKGIEEGAIGQVVAFFYRPWKFFTTFRAKFLKPVEEARKRLSDDCGAWKLAEDKRAADQARRDAEEAAEAERARLNAIADAATAAAAAIPVESPVREVLEQTAAQATQQAGHVYAMPAGPGRSTVPTTPTKGRKQWDVTIADEAAEDKFYEALFKDRTRRIAAPVDFGYLKRQAVDMGKDVENRFPGVTANEKGGLTANGRR